MDGEDGSNPFQLVSRSNLATLIPEGEMVKLVDDRMAVISGRLQTQISTQTTTICRQERQEGGWVFAAQEDPIAVQALPEVFDFCSRAWKEVLGWKGAHRTRRLQASTRS